MSIKQVGIRESNLKYTENRATNSRYILSMLPILAILNQNPQIILKKCQNIGIFKLNVNIWLVVKYCFRIDRIHQVNGDSAQFL